MNAGKEVVLKMLVNALNGFDTTISNASAVLKGSSGSAYAIPDIWDAIIELSEFLVPFCDTVIAICLLIELAQMASKVDIIKWEHGLKAAVKMVLAKVCIDVAPDFLKACYTQATSWMTKISNAISHPSTSALQSLDLSGSFGSTMAEQIEEALTDFTGFWPCLLLLLTAVIMFLLVKVCGLLIMVIAYARMFEIYVLAAVSPLPCAFLPLGDGGGSNFSRITMRYIKNFIAVCLQGVMMLLCLNIYKIIMAASLENFITAAKTGLDASASTGDALTMVMNLCFTFFIGAITLIVAITKCGSWAKSIMDAG